MFNRLIVLVSLAGSVLAAHLWVQERRGYDPGCATCSSPALAAASRVGGVPVAAVGACFYLALAAAAAVRLGREADGPGSSRRLNRVMRAGLGLAAGWSLFLVVYQAKVAHAFCPLCLGSAGLVVVLLALESLVCVADALALARSKIMGRIRSMDGFEAGAGAGTADSAEAGTGGTNRRFLLGAFAGGALVMGIVLVGLDRVGRPEACGFEEGGALSDGDAAAFMAAAGTSFLGRADGVPVVAFLDPNCAHCREADAVIRRLAGRLGDRARFEVVPRAIQGYSVDEVAALRLADRQGRAFDLWGLLFERQPAGGGTGLSPAQIGALFRELGLDGGDLRRRLAAERPAVEADEARAEAAGLATVPALFIGGRRVAAGPWDEGCLGRLIERVAAGQTSVGTGSVPQ